MTFSPNEHYRYSFKQGMEGWDVFAIQVALNSHYPSPNLVEDGSFGPKTSAAARELQTALHVTVDGIVGPQTQAAFCAVKCDRTKTIVPAGLLKGICFGESGGIIPTTSSLYPDGSRDYGPLQDNKSAASVTQAELREAFNPEAEARNVAEAIQSAHAFFKGQPGAKTEEAAWRLAVLNYNWPAAANAIARGERDTWVYTESGTGAKRRLTDAAPWVQAYGIPGVNTGADWCRFYVDSKTVYVVSWTVG